MSIMTMTDLADLLKASAPNDSVHINYNARTPIWRGTYGPFMIVSGTFGSGGDFEFALKIDEDVIAIDPHPERVNLYLVD